MIKCIMIKWLSGSDPNIEIFFFLMRRIALHAPSLQFY